jgi:flavin reductase (DIM6/NTAB) family NADH-FMN oxidoreductase RutF
VSERRDDTPPVEFKQTLDHRGFTSAAPEGIGETFPSEGEVQGLDIAGEGEDPSLGIRRIMGMFATGVTIISMRVGELVHGMTANAFMSVSLAPPLVLVSVDKRARMCGLLHVGLPFGISVLAESQAALSDRFAGRTGPELPEPQFDLVHDSPLLEGALAHIAARVERSYWGGDHSLFLGRVEYARRREGTPLLFHGGKYTKLG